MQRKVIKKNVFLRASLIIELYTMLEEEFQYYKDNQNELLEKYKGRFIAIVGKNVVGDFATFEEAVDQTIQTYELGKFLIQECKEGVESYTQTFQSRVVFA